MGNRKRSSLGRTTFDTLVFVRAQQVSLFVEPILPNAGHHRGSSINRGVGVGDSGRLLTLNLRSAGNFQLLVLVVFPVPGRHGRLTAAAVRTLVVGFEIFGHCEAVAMLGVLLVVRVEVVESVHHDISSD